jgi:hypothetical protein
MQGVIKVPFGLFLFVLLITGVELFVWLFLADRGYLNQLVHSDQSYVSILILVLYLLTTCWFIWLSFRISQYQGDLSDYRIPPREPLLRQYFSQFENCEDPKCLDVLETRLRSAYVFGFNIADIMLKLGILGTVIGFIIMLGSLSQLNSVDITVMQTLLVEMSGGMKVALLTTLSGLLSGIILNIKFNLIDWAVDHLINDIKERSLMPAVGS